MMSQKITWVNCGLAGFTILFFLLGVFYWIKRPNEITATTCATKECQLPKNAFALNKECYDRIGKPLLSLSTAPLELQLPDLRQLLLYYGKNGRPDAQSENALLHFSWNNGNKTVASIPPNEKLYLIFDRNSSPSRYAFSPFNQKSSLWIEAKPQEGEALVQLTLENEKGEKITHPEAVANFRLPEKEFVRLTGGSWDLGPIRVDGTLFAKQKARWAGVDRFLEHHGGGEYEYTEGRQRVDFGEGDDIYSVFVKLGDCLTWDHQRNRWKVIQPGKESQGSPLLVLKKIEDKIISFELWDIEGKGKLILNILKSNEPWVFQNTKLLQQMFKFMGARTRSQYTFEINREKMTISPSDWLLMTSKGWKKLETPEEIDQYVNRLLFGTLFVFEGVSRKNERQFINGIIYSPSRNDFQKVEISLQNQVKSQQREEIDEDEQENKEMDDAIKEKIRHPTMHIPK